jgi:hypothetical protein
VQRPRIISTITERFPRRRESNAALLDTDEESEQLHEELDAYNYNRPYYMTAESIVMHERATKALGHAQPEIQDMVVMDAHDLAARVLPPPISYAIGITAKHPDNVGIDYLAGNPPSLRALHLLLHAYDITRDPGLRHAVTYIIQACPPKLSELHREAYEYGTETNTAFIPTLQKLAVYTDDKLDGIE